MFNHNVEHYILVNLNVLFMVLEKYLSYFTLEGCNSQWDCLFDLGQFIRLTVSQMCSTKSLVLQIVNIFFCIRFPAEVEFAGNCCYLGWDSYFAYCYIFLIHLTSYCLSSFYLIIRALNDHYPLMFRGH